MPASCGQHQRHEDDVGSDVQGLGDRLAGRGGLGHHLEGPALLQRGRQRPAHEIVLVADEHPQRVADGQRTGTRHRFRTPRPRRHRGRVVRFDRLGRTTVGAASRCRRASATTSGPVTDPIGRRRPVRIGWRRGVAATERPRTGRQPARAERHRRHPQRGARGDHVVDHDHPPADPIAARSAAGPSRRSAAGRPVWEGPGPRRSRPATPSPAGRAMARASSRPWSNPRCRRPATARRHPGDDLGVDVTGQLGQEAAERADERSPVAVLEAGHQLADRPPRSGGGPEPEGRPATAGRPGAARAAHGAQTGPCGASHSRHPAASSIVPTVPTPSDSEGARAAALHPKPGRRLRWAPVASAPCSNVCRPARSGPDSPGWSSAWCCAGSASPRWSEPSWASAPGTCCTRGSRS